VPTARHQAEGNFDFLRIPAVWMCFGFFFVYAVSSAWYRLCARGGAPTARRAAGAGGNVPDGVHGVQRSRWHGAGRLSGVRPFSAATRVVGLAFGVAALVALRSGWPVPALAVPVLFGVMGFASGIAGPSRDLLVKKSTPENATGRVYGVVYSGWTSARRSRRCVWRADGPPALPGVWLGLVVMQGC
jgi:FSR family fosmidomycin resistance protein-like MFS transporter